MFKIKCQSCHCEWVARKSPNYGKTEPSFVKIGGAVQKCFQCGRADTLEIIKEGEMKKWPILKRLWSLF